MRDEEIDAILKKYKRIAVCGAAVTGKTIVTDRAKQIGDERPIYHSDELAGTEWSERSAILKDQALPHDTFLIAGVAADRAVRKGLEVDAIIHCRTPRKLYTRKGQKVLKKQIDKRVRALKNKGIPTFDLD